MSIVAETINERLLAWNPKFVAVTCRPINDLQAPLFEQEDASILRAVDKRRREFIAGRTAARISLSKLGISPCPVAAGPNREPLWPSGIVGTISHTDDLCIAVTAHQASHWALGVDLEVEKPLGAGLAEYVLSETEKQHATAPLIHYFAIKEAVFKAYFPASRAFLEFADVSLELTPERNTFRAHITSARPMPPWGERIVTGRYASVSGHVLSQADVRT